MVPNRGWGLRRRGRGFLAGWEGLCNAVKRRGLNREGGAWLAARGRDLTTEVGVAMEVGGTLLLVGVASASGLPLFCRSRGAPARMQVSPAPFPLAPPPCQNPAPISPIHCPLSLATPPFF